MPQDFATSCGWRPYGPGCQSWIDISRSCLFEDVLKHGDLTLWRQGGCWTKAEGWYVCSHLEAHWTGGGLWEHHGMAPSYKSRFSFGPPWDLSLFSVHCPIALWPYGPMALQGDDGASEWSSHRGAVPHGISAGFQQVVLQTLDRTIQYPGGVERDFGTYPEVIWHLGTIRNFFEDLEAKVGQLKDVTRSAARWLDGGSCFCFQTAWGNFSVCSMLIWLTARYETKEWCVTDLKIQFPSNDHRIGWFNWCSSDILVSLPSLSLTRTIPSYKRIQNASCYFNGSKWWWG